ncbi:hypothetical protein DERP_010178 [Dermatophagoides pteronyssinus]|uniref:Uncharacterized protein n=1 Tax=Dermatophagoides pteronyssinus TaxID=6956 RepID=A0ABQ8J6X2_DERPT|nr:hypothetical protein DERP_010178 [Dermatophagoides pteronyssinus]
MIWPGALATKDENENDHPPVMKIFRQNFIQITTTTLLLLLLVCCQPGWSNDDHNNKENDNGGAGGAAFVDLKQQQQQQQSLNKTINKTDNEKLIVPKNTTTTTTTTTNIISQLIKSTASASSASTNAQRRSYEDDDYETQSLFKSLIPKSSTFKKPIKKIFRSWFEPDPEALDDESKKSSYYFARPKSNPLHSLPQPSSPYTNKASSRQFSIGDPVNGRGLTLSFGDQSNEPSSASSYSQTVEQKPQYGYNSGNAGNPSPGLSLSFGGNGGGGDGGGGGGSGMSFNIGRGNGGDGRGMSLSLGRGNSGGSGLSFSFGGGGGGGSGNGYAQSGSASYPSYSSSYGGGSGYNNYGVSYGNNYNNYDYNQPVFSMVMPSSGKQVIEYNQHPSKMKMKINSSPRVKITTNTKDPLDKPGLEDEIIQEDIFGPPEPFDKPNRTSTSSMNETMPNGIHNMTMMMGHFNQSMYPYSPYSPYQHYYQYPYNYYYHNYYQQHYPSQYYQYMMNVSSMYPNMMMMPPMAAPPMSPMPQQQQPPQMKPPPMQQQQQQQQYRPNYSQYAASTMNMPTKTNTIQPSLMPMTYNMPVSTSYSMLPTANTMQSQSQLSSIYGTMRKSSYNQRKSLQQPLHSMKRNSNKYYTYDLMQTSESQLNPQQQQQQYPGYNLTTLALMNDATRNYYYQPMASSQQAMPGSQQPMPVAVNKTSSSTTSKYYPRKNITSITGFSQNSFDYEQSKRFGHRAIKYQGGSTKEEKARVILDIRPRVTIKMLNKTEQAMQDEELKKKKKDHIFKTHMEIIMETTTTPKPYYYNNYDSYYGYNYGPEVDDFGWTHEPPYGSTETTTMKPRTTTTTRRRTTTTESSSSSEVSEEENGTSESTSGESSTEEDDQSSSSSTTYRSQRYRIVGNNNVTVSPELVQAMIKALQEALGVTTTTTMTPIDDLDGFNEETTGNNEDDNNNQIDEQSEHEENDMITTTTMKPSILKPKNGIKGIIETGRRRLPTNVITTTVRNVTQVRLKTPVLSMRSGKTTPSSSQRRFFTTPRPIFGSNSNDNDNDDGDNLESGIKNIKNLIDLTTTSPLLIVNKLQPTQLNTPKIIDGDALLNNFDINNLTDDERRQMLTNILGVIQNRAPTTTIPTTATNNIFDTRIIRSSTPKSKQTKTSTKRSSSSKQKSTSTTTKTPKSTRLLPVTKANNVRIISSLDELNKETIGGGGGVNGSGDKSNQQQPIYVVLLPQNKKKK